MKRSVRILAGSLAPQTIEVPDLPELRPTAEKIRRSLFEILQQSLDQAVFIDVFAGCGIMGFEALSRGCASAVFFEKHHLAVRYLRKNIRQLGIQDQCLVIPGDAVDNIGRQISRITSDSVIFVDPPYRSDLLTDVLVECSRMQWLHRAFLICEHHHKRVIQNHYGTFHRYRQNRYGETMISFYGNIGEDR